MQVSNPHSIQAGINMTPMIDVLLVLIIIFMVITPVAPKGLPAIAPQDAPAESMPDDSAVVVEIDREGAYKLNSAPLAEADLPRRLREIYSTRVAKVVFVKAAANLEYQQITPIVDAARGAGIDHVGLLTK